MDFLRRGLGTGLLVGLSVLSAGAEEKATMTNHRTDGFKQARWGVFTHYMADTVLKDDAITVENWNRAVDSFDVEAYAERLAGFGTGYAVVTLGQNSGYYCSPNAVYDTFVGISPSKCSKRDLIADLAKALQPKNIRLMVYLPAGAPDRDKTACKALEWKPGKHPLWSHPDGGPHGDGLRLEAFQRKWEAVIGEWSTRWGHQVTGWWFDGCYYPHEMYYFADPPNFESFAAAARAGNPDAIVAFNPGVRYPVITMTPFEDYTAGEVNELDKVECPGRWVKQAQFHILSYLGPSWAQQPPRFSNEEMIAHTRRIIDKGGVVSWDVPIAADGGIAQPFVDQFEALAAALKP